MLRSVLIANRGEIVARIARTARRLGSIAGGADEVMLGIIAKYMHTLPARG